MGKCNYTLAGVDTFATLLDSFMTKYPGYISVENMHKFINESVNKYLYSFGSGLNYKTKKINPKYTEKMLKNIYKFSKIDFMKDASIFIDSGGFQISMGALDSYDIPKFIDIYYKFIEEFHNEFNYAFILDIPPGPKASFKSYEEVYELNKLSYQRAQKVPEHIKKKIIYIHHFRTPQLYNVWSKLFFEDNLCEGFDYFGTGGLVAYSSQDISISAILYCLPLATVLKYVLKNNIKEFKFHVLGGANYLDVLWHKLFEKHIREFYKIDCQITYDSSSIFKGAFGGRFLSVFDDNNNIIKMSFRSKDLHLRFDKCNTVEQKMYKTLNRIAELYDLKPLTPEEEPIYSSETGTLSKPVSNYVMLYVLQFYKDIENYCKKVVDNLYKHYKNSDESEFNTKAIESTIPFNQGRITKKQKSKTLGVYNSLKILENLDEEYNKYIINKYTAGGDLVNMSSGLKLF